MTDLLPWFLKKAREDFPWFAQNFLRIENREGHIVPFELNPMQVDLHDSLTRQKAETGQVRVVVLKARQMGLSTYCVARAYWNMLLSNGAYKVRVIAHRDDTAKMMLDMASRFHREIPIQDIIHKTTGLTQHSLELSNGSFMQTSTAGIRVSGSGRGGTSQHLHSTETAFQQNAHSHVQSMMNQIQGDNTEIVMESTAAGPVGAFYDQYQSADAGDSPFLAKFYPWYVDPRYVLPAHDFAPDPNPPNDYTPSEKDIMELHQLTPEQMQWRRQKIRDLDGAARGYGHAIFMQEFPTTAEDAFSTGADGSFIRSIDVLRAEYDPPLPRSDPAFTQPLVLGVDPAQNVGKDNTCIVWRRGGTVTHIERNNWHEPDQVANSIYAIAMRDGADAIFIEEPNLGRFLITNLRNRMGTRDIIHGVQPGGRADDADRHGNRRCQNWDRMREAMLMRNLRIPRERGRDRLSAELLSTKSLPGSAKYLQLERKDQVVKRLGHSPDGADALAATFDFNFHNYQDDSGYHPLKIHR